MSLRPRIATSLVVLMLAACASGDKGGPGPAPRASLEAVLTGSNNVPAGDADGTGLARISLNERSNTVCTALSTGGLSPIDLAHIHRGRAGEAGPVVVSVDPPDSNAADDCKLVDKNLVRQIRDDPSGFYVDVHSDEYPRGAIRGQISRR